MRLGLEKMKLSPNHPPSGRGLAAVLLLLVLLPVKLDAIGAWKRSLARRQLREHDPQAAIAWVAQRGDQVAAQDLAVEVAKGRLRTDPCEIHVFELEHKHERASELLAKYRVPQVHCGRQK